MKDNFSKQAALRVIFLTVFLDILGFGIVIPQLGVYSTKFGAQGWVIGLLGASYSIMQFVFAPFWGRISDRRGRRPILLLSIFGSACGYVIFAVAHSLPLLFLSRIIDGFTGANISVAQAYISDISEPEERTKLFGLFGAIFGIGFVLGPAVGLLLSQLPGAWGGNLGVGVFTAVLGFINWALALKRLPESLPKEQRDSNREKQSSQRTLRKDGTAKRSLSPINVRAFVSTFQLKGLNLMLVIAFVATAAFGNLQVTYTPFLIAQYIRPQIKKQIHAHPLDAAREAEVHLNAAGALGASAENPDKTTFSSTFGAPLDETGLPPAPKGLSWSRIESTLVSQLAVKYANALFVTIGIAAIIVQGGLIPLLRKRIKEIVLLISGIVIMTIGLALVPLSPVYAGQFPIAILIALGNGLFTPVLSALVSEHSPVAERGEIFGVYQSMQSLGRIIGPLMGGAIFQFVSHSAPYFTGAAIMLLAIYFATRLRTFCEEHEAILGAPEPQPEPVMEA